MQKHQLFPLEIDIEQLSETDFLINEFFYENDLKEEYNKKEDEKHYNHIDSEVSGNSINNPNKNPKESSLPEKCEEINELHESFNSLKNFSGFQNSSDYFQNNFVLMPEEQEIKIVNEADEYKIFSKSMNKEYSYKYSRKKIFNVVKLNCKRRRKYMGDDKRKKIKSDFYKQIRIELNNRLKEQKIKMLFNWPQIMVTDITKVNNKNILNMTLGELLSKGDSACKSSKSEKKDKKPEDKKPLIPLWKLLREYLFKIQIEKTLQNNQEIINILKKNEELNINKFLNMKMEYLYKEYIQSDKFENSIKKLINKGHYFEYVKDYIDIANNFVDFYKYNKRVNKV